MEETFHSAKEGIKSSLYESLMKEGVSNLNEKFHKIIDNTRSELFQDNLDDAPPLEFKATIKMIFLFLVLRIIIIF